MNKYYILMGVLSLFMLSCSPRTIIGLYQTDGEGKVLMAGHEYNFLPDSTFTMSYWSDSMGDNKKGTGTYRTRGKQLTLRYEDFSIPEATYEWYPLEEMDNGKTYYQFKVEDAAGQLLGGLMIQLLDSSGQPLAEGVTQMNGTYNITITKAQPAQTITLRYLGMEAMDIMLNDRMSSGFNIAMVSKSNYVPAGTVEQFRIKSTATYIQLDDGSRRLRLVGN
jgi:hypothetical protein